MLQDSAGSTVSIVIVSWNAWRYVDECLSSLRAGTTHAEIIVVDNASSDGTPALVQEKYPEVVLVENSRNVGFAKGNNIGIARSRGEYLFLINSDVNVPPRCLEWLVSVMNSDPRIGMVGPQMLGPNGEVRRSTMRYPTLSNMFCRALALDTLLKGSRWAGGFLMSDFAHDHTRDVEVLNGWFWGLRRKAIEQVGLLDERFFMYGEDIDWSLRFRKAGWRVVFCAEAAARHYGGASSAAAPIRFHIEMLRANLQFWQKHHGWFSRVLYHGVAFLHELIRILGYSIVYVGLAGSRKRCITKLQHSRALLRWLARSWYQRLRKVSNELQHN